MQWPANQRGQVTPPARSPGAKPQGPGHSLRTGSVILLSWYCIWGTWRLDTWKVAFKSSQNIQSRPSPIWPCPPLYSLKGMLSYSKDTRILLFPSFIMLSHASVNWCCCLCVAFSPAKPPWQTPPTPSNLSSSIISSGKSLIPPGKLGLLLLCASTGPPQLYKLGVWTLLVSKSVSKLGTSSSQRESDYLRILLLHLRSQVS